MQLGHRVDLFRREPFRLFFPLGALLAWSGVLPWVLFGTGAISTWPGAYHALTMTESFLPAIAVGFLGTMIPRRAEAAPMSAMELGLATVGLVAVPMAMAAGAWLPAQIAYAAVLATMAQFAIRRLRRARRPPPPSFVFIPVGLLLGLVGAGLIAAFSLGAPAELLGAGRSLVQEGVLVSLVLALAPMLTPIVCHGTIAPAAQGDSPPRHTRPLHLLASLAFAASFAIEHAVSPRAGLLLRGAVVTTELLLAARLRVPPSVPGLHRRVYRLALALVPVGLLTAGAWPAWRLPLLHLTFVGGLSLLVFAVSVHVALLHTGHDRLASRRPWPVAAVALLTLLAMATRASAERLPDGYVTALALAAATWLMGVAIWAVFVLRLLLRRGPHATA